MSIKIVYSPWALRLAVAVLAFAPTARTLEAQVGVPKYDELRTPTSPAFTVLGIAPTAVDQPAAVSAFAASFVNAFSAETPEAFALETAPYWWKSHPTLTFEKYQGRGLASFNQDLTLSIAVTDSAPKGRGVGAGFRRAGLGMRLPLIHGKQQAPACVGDLLQRLAEVRQPATDSLARFLARPGNIAIVRNNPSLVDSIYEGFVRKTLGADSVVVSKKAVEDCSAALSARQGLVVDLAGGLAYNFAEGRASDGRLGAAAIWINPAYLQEWGGFAGVARASWDDLDLDDADGARALDLGGRVIRAGEGWNVSGEAVYRHLSTDATADNLMRLSAIFDLKVTPVTWLTFTLGRDFDADEPQSLLALVNFQWNTGNTRPERPAGLVRE